MRDFTLDIYRELLETLQAKGYKLIPFAEYCRGVETSRSKDDEKFVILRHDVDAKPLNSLKTAQIEHALGARASYYFRCGKESNIPSVIKSVVRLGHEIGYHYEDMSLCNGNIKQAWSHFQTWLEYFRQFYAVETICMHGAPTSQWDSKELWKHYSYKALGIIGEPYLDTDFSDVFYMTDTGRCWDGYKVSVRDKIPGYQEEWSRKGRTWHTTPQLMCAIENNQLPPHVMITTHPQRWTNDTKQWYLELVKQTMKNIIKGFMVKKEPK